MLSSVLIWLFLAALIATYNSNFFSSVCTGNYNLGVWSSPFECGFLAHSVKVNSFSNGLFMLLVFFVIFDLEVSLLLNAAFQEEFFSNLVYYALFLIMVAGGYTVEVAFGFVRWAS